MDGARSPCCLSSGFASLPGWHDLETEAGRRASAHQLMKDHWRFPARSSRQHRKGPRASSLLWGWGPGVFSKVWKGPDPWNRRDWPTAPWVSHIPAVPPGTRPLVCFSRTGFLAHFLTPTFYLFSVLDLPWSGCVFCPPPPLVRGGRHWVVPHKAQRWGF